MSDPFLMLVTHMRLAQLALAARPTIEGLKRVRYLERLTDVAIKEESKPGAAGSLWDRIVEDVDKV